MKFFQKLSNNKHSQNTKRQCSFFLTWMNRNSKSIKNKFHQSPHTPFPKQNSYIPSPCFNFSPHIIEKPYIVCRSCIISLKNYPPPNTAGAALSLSLTIKFFRHLHHKGNPTENENVLTFFPNFNSFPDFRLGVCLLNEYVIISSCWKKKLKYFESKINNMIDWKVTFFSSNQNMKIWKWVPS